MRHAMTMPHDVQTTERTPGAFFGRRKGHPLRARQAALLDTLLPQLALDLSKPAPADLRALFPTASTTSVSKSASAAASI